MEGTCGTCTHAIEPDLACRRGLITVDQYEVHAGQTHPQWPGHMIDKIRKSFAVCEQEHRFVEQREVCDGWKEKL